MPNMEYNTAVKRDVALDVTKGILILMVVLHHVVDIGCRRLNIDNTVLHAIGVLQYPLILCFFMQTFFLISGMCSDFSYDFKTFFWKNVRGLMIPAFCFMCASNVLDGNAQEIPKGAFRFMINGGPYWFLSALFVGKILYWILKKYISNRWLVLAVLFAFSYSATWLNKYDIGDNLYAHRQALDMTVFITIGDMFKSYFRDKKLAILSALAFGILVLVGVMIYGYKIPYVTWGFGALPANWVLHIALAFFGSLALLGFSRLLGDCPWLVYLGRQTIVIYMIQWGTLCTLIQVFAHDLRVGGGVMMSLEIVFLLLAATCAKGICIAYILDKTPMRIILGRPYKPFFTFTFRKNKMIQSKNKCIVTE